ncbi:helix-turn-helix domain-containing protein [Corynebacterium glyciniphilum]|uniref:helix-turn-helix domain-containing protein n=1 Tax=Corynebacterium glyciniphilum TaxID=1404244 RepID=UPI001642C692|nr:helix-turn-helix domain-containing protein [Corynebacterium glyciniphilum]
MLNEDLTAKEVAAILGVSPATMVVWRNNGKGPGWYQIGGRYRYPQRDLDQFINSIRTS